MPINTLLLGANSKTTKLTHKQTKFAEEIAKGESKAQAYRNSHNSKGNPNTTSKNGQVLLKNPMIQTQVDAFKVALEAEKYTTPAHLRSHIIHSLTQKTLDPSVPHAQQLRALELLGKITEVSLFTQRIEHIKTDNSESMREKLIKSLSLAINSTGKKEMVEYSAESLLAELAGEAPVDDDATPSMYDEDHIGDTGTDISLGDASLGTDLPSPTPPATPILHDLSATILHSIPLTRSQTFENPQPNQTLPTITSVMVQGEGVEISQDKGAIAPTETPPVTVWTEKG